MKISGVNTELRNILGFNMKKTLIHKWVHKV